MAKISAYTGREIILCLCPFCGGDPVMSHIGNEWTKSRKIEIKCKGCRVKRIDAAISHGFDWLEEVSIKNWNQSPIMKLTKDRVSVEF